MQASTIAQRREARYRALADAGRRHLLRLIEDADEPIEVADLADRLGLHQNTVRGHLELLEEAGLVERTIETRTRPGRPRHLYTAAPRELRAPESEGYRFLAEVLASWIEGSTDDPGGAAAQAGEAWGRYLVTRPAPYTRPDMETAVDEVLTVLAELGFAPRERDDKGRTVVELHDCPFRDIARDRASVVCSVHLGLLRGMFEELGGAASVDGLEPFVEPSLCRVTLSPRPSGRRPSSRES